MRRREFVIGLGITALGRAVEAADSYPARPIRWLVGFAAGGASDIVVRLVAEGMQKELGVPLIVDNRPGASGNLAAGALVQAPAACAPLRCTRPSDWRACPPCRPFPSSGSAAFPLSSCMASSVPGACPGRWSND